MKELDLIKERTNTYIDEIDVWRVSNKLSELPQYNDLKNKEIWGTHYRDDQNYYEIIADFKANLFSIRGIVTKLKISEPKIKQVEHDSYIGYLDEQLKALESQLSVAKQRLKFYQDVQYVISNMGYGDF